VANALASSTSHHALFDLGVVGFTLDRRIALARQARCGATSQPGSAANDSNAGDDPASRPPDSMTVRGRRSRSDQESERRAAEEHAPGRLSCDAARRGAPSQTRASWTGPTRGGPQPYWDIDTGFAALLMWLTATDAGLAACFFGIPIEMIESFRSAFAVPPQFTPIGAISIGYDDEPPANVSATRERVRAMRKPLAQTVHRGRWNLPFTGQPS
jgi:nitroreductase